MAYRAVIPYESLDPLTIGASDDESKVNRDTLELEIPERNLLAAIYPDEPPPVPDATDAARYALEHPVSGRSFSSLLAGAKSVVASLWMVDDRSTATLMGKFYEHVGRGKSVAVALSDAQREMIQEFGENFSPYYWAGFLVMGDGTRQISFGATKADKGAASQRLR